MARINKTT